MHAMGTATANYVLMVAILSFQINVYQSGQLNSFSALAGVGRKPYLYFHPHMCIKVYQLQAELDNTEGHTSYIEYLLRIKAHVDSLVSNSGLDSGEIA